MRMDRKRTAGVSWEQVNISQALLTLVINSLKDRNRIADEIVLNGRNGNLHLDYDLIPEHYAPLGICYICRPSW